MNYTDEKEPASPTKEYAIDEKASASASIHGVGEGEKAAFESDLVVLSQDIDAVYDRAIRLSVEEVTEILEDAWLEHHDDPNFPSTVKDKIEYFLSGDSATLENYDLLLEEMKIEAGLIRFSSPYPEVRSVVKCEDDPTMYVSTARVWIIGTVWCGIGSFINQFFSIRQPSFTLSVNEIQLLSYPFAKFLEFVLPTRTLFHVRGKAFTLNPGPFNEKEHMLITIMANVGMFAPYTVNVLITQKLPIFYNQEWAGNFGYQIITGLSIQLIGMGFAGMTRRFIVYPEHCIWLINLSTIALNKSFHSNENPIANGWRISRLKFFSICFSAMFVYYWLPGILLQCISYFNWINWINPTSIGVAAVFGTIGGMGFNPLPTLDWSQFYGTTIMVQPFFSTANQFLGMLITGPIILGFWYANVWNTAYFPMISNRIFANDGGYFNVTKVLDENRNLDVDAYKAYSEPYMAASNIVLYCCFFAAYSATVTHTLLYHRREIYVGFKTAYKSIRAGQQGNLAFKDYHNQAMAKYKEVPEWMYLILTLFAIILGCIGLTVYPTHSSVSSIFFGVALCIVFVIPIGIIYSITNAEITLNVFAEFIGGLIYPGNALAMNYFKSYGVMACSNALLFAQDLKLAHYMKIDQRYCFGAQVYGAIIATFISTAILNWQMTLYHVCQTDQPQHFICNGEATFFTATVFWGTLGPTRVFGTNGIYTPLLWGFGIGGLLPVVFWLIRWKWPKSIVSKVHVVAALYGTLAWGPYSTMANYYPGLVVAWFFQVYIKKRYLPWWSKYNYILAVGFGAAIPIAALIIFGAISSSSAGDAIGEWSVNNIMYNNADGEQLPRLDIPDVGYVGAAPGSGAWA